MLPHSLSGFTLNVLRRVMLKQNMWKPLTDFAAEINTPTPVKSPVCCNGELTVSHTEIFSRS